jgi:enoyl-CoA hydratase/carnithine racemase
MTDTTTNEGAVGARQEGAVRIITLDAPQRLNALSPQMRMFLRDALRAAHEDAGVRSIVLTGAGQTFSAGGDVRQMAERPPPLVSRQRLDVLHDVIRQVMTGPKPVVAAVEGVAYGAGLSLAAACDHVIAGEGSRFSAAFGRLGLVADCGLFWTLPQRAGIGPTREILMTGRPFDAAEALRFGLVDAVVSAGTALECALQKAREYEAVAPLAIAATKSVLARRPASLEDALAIEADLQAFLRGTRDHQEASAAFLAKRPVTFEGR